jgi:uncharacterized protein with GYD domain
MAAKNKRPTKTGQPMKYYLVQFSYTPEAWADMIGDESKRDRIAAVKPLVTALKGCFAQIYFPPCEPPSHTTEGKFAAFGDHDVVALLAFPDDQHAAAFAMSVSQGHGVKSFKTTPLLAWDEAMAAMALAKPQISTYSPPGRGRRR